MAPDVVDSSSTGHPKRPCSSNGRASVCNRVDVGSIPTAGFLKHLRSVKVSMNKEEKKVDELMQDKYLKVEFI